MATKAKETVVENTEVETTEVETAEVETAEDKELVDFEATYVPGFLENDVRIVHNGKAITVKRGESVKIPIGHKKIYDRSQKLLKEAKERALKRQNAYKNAGK